MNSCCCSARPSCVCVAASAVNFNGSACAYSSCVSLRRAEELSQAAAISKVCAALPYPCNQATLCTLTALGVFRVGNLRCPAGVAGLPGVRILLHVCCTCCAGLACNPLVARWLVSHGPVGTSWAYTVQAICTDSAALGAFQADGAQDGPS
jgi:hypothetical protein